MTDRDPMGPERLGELVDGAAPHGEEERALVDLLTETRALEPAATRRAARARARAGAPGIRGGSAVRRSPGGVRRTPGGGC